jgi:hypothetical protein
VVQHVARNHLEKTRLNDLENEFQFQLQGYAASGGAVNPLHHKRA